MLSLLIIFQEPPTLGKTLLCVHGWDVQLIVQQYQAGSEKLLIDSKLAPKVKCPVSPQGMIHILTP